MKEKCAIIGYYCINNQEKCVPDCINSLKNLQHRGRESSGISYLNNINEWGLFRGIGLVKDVYKNFNFNEPIKSIIGHNRYSTSGKTRPQVIMQYNDELDCIEDKNCTLQIQPFYDSSCNFSFVHNGNIQGVDYCLNDSHELFNKIKSNLNDGKDMKSILINILQTKKGIYNLIIQTQDGLYLVKDRFGVRPFFYGYKSDNIVICGSETVSCHENVMFSEEVKPGEIIYIGENEKIIPYKTKKQKIIHKLYQLPEKHINPSFCMFEYFYFMNHHSKLNNETLYDIRFKFGSLLAKNDISQNFNLNQEETIIVGSPNSGIAAGEGYALFSGLTYKQCIKKRENIGRTFILPTDNERKQACNKAFEFDIDDIKDKNVIIVDDTIVRGNTFKSLIQQLNDLGKPKSIHVRIASPKIVEPCNLGIDLPTKEELVVNKTDNLCDYLECNSIMFLDLEEIKSVVGNNLCSKICGCFEKGEKYNDW